eukprot:12323317-Ditylum_brightwellii.AAC.1
MESKLLKIQQRRYMTQGLVLSIMRFFPVPKGENDICMVYDGTDSGLSDAVWVPNFGLPTINTVLHFTNEHTFMADLDIGEMLLNFMMPEDLQSYCGIDISHWLGKKGKKC